MTISEIKNKMTAEFVGNTDVRVAYGLDVSKTFEQQFSKVSIESILFYVFASALWSLERLFEIHKKEVSDDLSTRKPHRLKWYRDKTLAYQDNYVLVADDDVYAVVDEGAKIVKYAAAVETSDSSKLFVKVAGESGGKRVPLSAVQASAVYDYLKQIKDCGVRIELVNKSADLYKADLDIYFDATLLADRVEDKVRSAVVSHLENLPFNGEYSNAALVDVLQGIEGVVIPELLKASSKPDAIEFDYLPINAKTLPVSGYFAVKELKIKMLPYELAQD